MLASFPLLLRLRTLYSLHLRWSLTFPVTLALRLMQEVDSLLTSFHSLGKQEADLQDLGTGSHHGVKT